MLFIIILLPSVLHTQKMTNNSVSKLPRIRIYDLQIFLIVQPEVMHNTHENQNASKASQHTNQ